MCICIEWPEGGTVSHSPSIQSIVSAGSGQKKTVYVDSPLLKTEMAVRERSHFYHEESLKLSIRKDRSKKVFHLLTDIPASENQLHVVC